MDDALRKVHEARIAAVLAGDLDRLDQYVADDLSYTSPRGKVMSKRDVFDGFASGAMVMQRMEVEDLKCRQHGDAAIVTYRADTTVVHHGTLIDEVVRSTAVYLRRDSVWKLAAQQQTPIVDH